MSDDFALRSHWCLWYPHLNTQRIAHMENKRALENVFIIKIQTINKEYLLAGFWFLEAFKMKCYLNHYSLFSNIKLYNTCLSSGGETQQRHLHWLKVKTSSDCFWKEIPSRHFTKISVYFNWNTLKGSLLLLFSCIFFPLFCLIWSYICKMWYFKIRYLSINTRACLLCTKIMQVYCCFVFLFI